MKPGDTLVVEARELDALLGALRERGHTLLGPTVRDGAIVLAEIGGAADLPAGWSDEQEGGRYRLQRRDDAAFFGYAVGPHSWQRYVHPPALVRWRARSNDRVFVAAPGTVISRAPGMSDALTINKNNIGFDFHFLKRFNENRQFAVRKETWDVGHCFPRPGATTAQQLQIRKREHPNPGKEVISLSGNVCARDR